MSRLRRGPSWGPSTKSCRAGSGEARVAPGRGDCPLRRFRAEPCCGGSSPANVLHFLVKGHALRRLQETSGGRAPSPPSATVPSSSIYHTRCPKVHKEKWGGRGQGRAEGHPTTEHPLCAQHLAREQRGGRARWLLPRLRHNQGKLLCPKCMHRVHCPCPELPQGLGGEGRG